MYRYKHTIQRFIKFLHRSRNDQAIMNIITYCMSKTLIDWMTSLNKLKLKPTGDSVEFIGKFMSIIQTFDKLKVDVETILQFFLYGPQCRKLSVPIWYK